MVAFVDSTGQRYKKIATKVKGRNTAGFAGTRSRWEKIPEMDFSNTDKPAGMLCAIAYKLRLLSDAAVYSRMSKGSTVPSHAKACRLVLLRLYECTILGCFLLLSAIHLSHAENDAFEVSSTYVSPTKGKFPHTCPPPSRWRFSVHGRKCFSPPLLTC